MRHLARLVVILIALSASTRALAQTPALDLQRAVAGARHQRQAGLVLTVAGIGISVAGSVLLLTGALTAGETDGPWVGMFLSGAVLTPLGATIDATGIPLLATARVRF